MQTREIIICRCGATYYTGYTARRKIGHISRHWKQYVRTRKGDYTAGDVHLAVHALKVIGQLPQGDSDKTLNHFSGAGQIDLWAKEAMTLLVKTGTIGVMLES